MQTRTTIIPIASGKGGVGKSLLTANLAMALARAGHSTVAVDLDLGGSNLHTYLGIPNKHPGIGDFLKGKQISFSNLLLPTRLANLKFIPGDGKTPFMANTPIEQRRRLIGELGKIKSRYVLLDLGAGSNFNTLNFFGLTNRAAIVSTFETAAIMNSLMFLRNFMFRLLTSALRKNQPAFDLLTSLFKRSIREKPLTVNMIMDRVAEIDPALASDTLERLRLYRPRFFFNMGENADDLKICPSIGQSIKSYLSLEADFFGYIPFDENVRKSAKTGRPLLEDFPHSPASRCVNDLAEAIIMEWDSYTEKSAAKLLADTKKKSKIL